MIGLEMNSSYCHMFILELGTFLFLKGGFWLHFSNMLLLSNVFLMIQITVALCFTSVLCYCYTCSFCAKSAHVSGKIIKI